MQYLICLSSLIFTVLLIRATLENRPDRFRYKLITCAHFLLLGFGALVFAHPQSRESTLLLGLSLSFCSDICLGLRVKRKIYLPPGILFFILAQFAYLSVFSFRFFNPLLFAATMFIQIVLHATLIMKSELVLKTHLAPFIMIYDFVLVGVFTLALG